MTDAAMINDGIMGATARRGLNRVMEDFLLRSLPAAAKAGPRSKPVIAALKPSTPSRQNRACWGPKHCATRNLAPAFFIATSLWLLSVSDQAQAQLPTKAQPRQQLLQDLDSGQLRDAVLLGQQAVSRWPRDAQFRHYLGVAYFKSGDLKQGQEQLTRARELNPKDSAIHLDLALVLLSQPDYAGAADELEAAIKLNPSIALWHTLLGRAYLNSNSSLPAIGGFTTALRRDPALGS